MSRDFKYKTAESLQNDAQARGLTIRLQADLAPLRLPLTLGSRRVGNRLAIQPMEGCDGTLHGEPDELTFRRYVRFGAGGAKLIWGEAAAVVPEGRANTRQLVICEEHAAPLAKMLADCRKAHRDAWGDDSDLVVGLQLTHSGRYSVPRPFLAQHDPLLDPRTVMDKSTGAKATSSTPLLTDDDLDRLQDRYVQAAALAERIGFDFVDIKQCHRYLLNELLASKLRPGKYGGSYENRTRFIRELIPRIRQECPHLLLATRLNVFDSVPYQRGPNEGVGIPAPFTRPVKSVWGTREDDPFEPDLSEPLALIGEIHKLGVSLVNISLGNPYGSPHLLRPFEYAPVDGYLPPEHPLIGVDRHFRLAGAVQTTYPDLAVVGSGYSWLQAYLFQAGAANVAERRVSLVGIGRASLSQPDVGRHILYGDPLDPKRICRTFSYCTALMRAKHNELGQFAAGCPPFDKAVYGPIWDEARSADASPKEC